MTYRSALAAQRDDLAVVAHRGDWSVAAENSLAAITAAADLGAFVAEVDVRRTACGALILLHDDTTLRMTGHDLAPEDATLEDLRRLRLFARDGETGQHTGAMIPTLEEALYVAKGRIFLDLDLKDPAIAPDVIACLQAIRAADMVDMKFPVASEDDARALARLQQESGVAMMAQVSLDRAVAEQAMTALLAAPPFMAEVTFDDLGTLATCTARLAEAGTAVWVNTLVPVHSLDLHDGRALPDPDAVWGRLLDAGVRAIQTDEPAALLDWLRLRRVAA